MGHGVYILVFYALIMRFDDVCDNVAKRRLTAAAAASSTCDFCCFSDSFVPLTRSCGDGVSRTKWTKELPKNWTVDCTAFVRKPPGRPRLSGHRRNVPCRVKPDANSNAMTATTSTGGDALRIADYRPLITCKCPPILHHHHHLSQRSVIQLNISVAPRMYRRRWPRTVWEFETSAGPVAWPGIDRMEAAIWQTRKDGHIVHRVRAFWQGCHSRTNRPSQSGWSPHNAHVLDTVSGEPHSIHNSIEYYFFNKTSMSVQTTHLITVPLDARIICGLIVFVFCPWYIYPGYGSIQIVTERWNR